MVNHVDQKPVCLYMALSESHVSADESMISVTWFKLIFAAERIQHAGEALEVHAAFLKPLQVFFELGSCDKFKHVPLRLKGCRSS